MQPIDLLKRFGDGSLTPEEELSLARELSAAYHMDEVASTSRDVRRIAEKIRARLADLPDENAGTATGEAHPTLPA